MIFSFLFIYIFVVNIVYYVVHIVCQVDVIANSLVLYLPFCSTLNKNFFSSSLSSSGQPENPPGYATGGLGSCVRFSEVLTRTL